jgi:hypothetical protein
VIVLTVFFSLPLAQPCLCQVQFPKLVYRPTVLSSSFVPPVAPASSLLLYRNTSMSCIPNCRCVFAVSFCLSVLVCICVSLSVCVYCHAHQAAVCFVPACVWLSVCLSACVSLSCLPMCVCSSVCLSSCMYVFLCVCLPAFLSACVCLSYCVCVCLPVCLSSCVSVCLCVCLLVCVCLPVCLSACVCLPVDVLVYPHAYQAAVVCLCCLSVCLSTCLSGCISNMSELFPHFHDHHTLFP